MKRFGDRLAEESVLKGHQTFRLLEDDTVLFVDSLPEVGETDC